jgi:hypothetical protein
VRTPIFSFAALVSIAALGVYCGGTSSRSGFDDSNVDGGPGESTGEGGKGGGFGQSGEGGATMGCNGIGCKAVQCGSMPPTTITGRVFDPAGKNPLYNVIVYIPPDPDAPLPALTQGVSCDKCGATALNPVASTLTDENGNFTLTNVPVTTGVPIVVQVGKWRKKISFDVSTQCAENKITNPITLPKNGMEGDMPQIAITQGALDALECLVRGIGVDESEFNPGIGGSGHVHLFQGYGGGGMTGGATVPDVSALVGDIKWLSVFDIVMLSCEGDEHLENKPKAAMQAMHDFAEAGGRIFATHYHYSWFRYNPQADWQGVANWDSGSDGMNYPVVTSFPKGMSFAKWLDNVGAASANNANLNDVDVTDSLSSVNTMTSQAWITSSDNSSPNASDVKYFSFNTPISAAPANQCGRAVFGDIHSAGMGGMAFPTGCSGTDLSAQQKALEFLFFDLSSCVQSDATQPTPPK